MVVQFYGSNIIKSLDKNYYKEILDLIKEDFKILLIGNMQEIEFLNEFSLIKNVYIMAGKLSLLESICITKYSSLFIGIDSVFAHFARYFNIPHGYFLAVGDMILCSLNLLTIIEINLNEYYLIRLIVLVAYGIVFIMKPYVYRA